MHYARFLFTACLIMLSSLCAHPHRTQNTVVYCAAHLDDGLFIDLNRMLLYCECCGCPYGCFGGTNIVYISDTALRLRIVEMIAECYPPKYLQFLALEQYDPVYDDWHQLEEISIHTDHRGRRYIRMHDLLRFKYALHKYEALEYDVLLKGSVVF